MRVDLARLAELTALGVPPELIPDIFAIFRKYAAADASARYRGKPDRRELARRKPRTGFSADAIPEPRRTADAGALGLPADRVAETFGHFRDYHTGKGTVAADWPATWRTWLRTARRMDRLNPDRADGRPIARTEYQQRQQEARDVVKRLDEWEQRQRETRGSDGSG